MFEVGDKVYCRERRPGHAQVDLLEVGKIYTIAETDDEVFSLKIRPDNAERCIGWYSPVCFGLYKKKEGGEKMATGMATSDALCSAVGSLSSCISATTGGYSTTIGAAQYQPAQAIQWSTYPNGPLSPLYSTTTDAKPKKKETKMLGKVKEYIEEHKNIIFTLGLVILVDHFLFKGALRERIKTSIEGVLKKVEEQFHKEG